MEQSKPSAFKEIQAALEGPDESQCMIAAEGLMWIRTLLRKNQDYGDSVFKVPVLNPTANVGDAILIRMSDKIERIRNLKAGHTPKVDESLVDTVKDLGAYCLLWTIAQSLTKQDSAT